MTINEALNVIERNCLNEIEKEAFERIKKEIEILELNVDIQFQQGYERKQNEEKCLHCGKNETKYCENCFQQLIAENAGLQNEIKKRR